MNDTVQTLSTLALLNAVGFFLKNHAPWCDNKYIPTVLVLVGVAAQLAIHGTSLQNALEGFLAAVGAVGTHSAIKNTIQPKAEPPPPTP